MRRNAVLLVGFVVALVALALAASQKKTSKTPASHATPAAAQAAPPPTVSANAPFVVPPPQTLHPPFDWFSWETFIALNWPAAIDATSGLPVRGQPDLTKQVGDPGWRVWETYKADWETFGNGSAQPSPMPWSSWQVNGNMNPCATNAAMGKKPIFVMVSKMDSVLGGFNEANAGPLIDANGNYVRYEILLNSTEYNSIVSNQWYLSNNLPLQVSFPSSTTNPNSYGAIEVKAAWRELIQGTDDFTRYYSVNATILDPGSPPTCRDATMGLIGLHLAVKTAPFTEWVWATFEQEDNVPDGGIQQGIHYSLNNGTTAPPSSVNGFNYPPNGANAQTQGPAPLAMNQPLPKGTPVQVTRFTAIDSNIAAANQTFHGVLTGTVWVHYNLVADQWPTNNQAGVFQPGKPYPAASGSPFPNDHVANTAAETYFQNAPAPGGLGNSCMQCHFQAAFTDFSWTLNDEAYPPLNGASLAAATANPKMAHRANALNALHNSMRQRFAASK